MYSTPEQRYRKLFDSIAQTHPSTAAKLQSIDKRFGLQAAQYVAAPIVCLVAHLQVSGVQVARDLSREDVEKLSYFEHMKDNVHALELLVHVLEYHLAEYLAYPPHAAHEDRPAAFSS